MNTDETIRTFITFFRDRGHQPIGSSSLVSPPRELVTELLNEPDGARAG
jgi:hypothetical protein